MTVQDGLVDSWTYSLNAGRFTPSNYKFLIASLEVDPIFKLRKSKCMTKPKVFAWSLLMERLNTKDLMLRKNWHLKSGLNCLLYSEGIIETRNHLFFECSFVAR